MRTLGGIVVALLIGLTAGAAPAHAQLEWDPPRAIDPGKQLTSVSCPSETFCAAVDAAGNVLTTSDPRSASWSITEIGSGHRLREISCASSRLCAVVDNDGNVLTSEDTAGGAGAWRSVHLLDVDDRTRATSGLSAIACPSATFCIAVERAGDVFTTTDPSSGVTWTRTRIIGTPCRPGEICNKGGLNAISCPSPALCVVVDSWANAFISTAPAGGAETWRQTETGATLYCHATCLAPLFDVSCLSTPLCLAATEDGRLVESTDPQLARWFVLEPRFGATFNVVDCATGPLCLAAYRKTGQHGGRHGMVASNLGSGIWTDTVPETLDSDSPPITDVDCPSAWLCVAVDAGGNALVAGPTADRIVAWLNPLLVPHGRAARIGALVRRKTYAMQFSTATPGVLEIKWRGRTQRGNLLTIASARHRFIASGQATKKLRLTRRGASLLRGSKRLKVEATATLARPDRGSVVVSRSFTLRR